MSRIASLVTLLAIVLVCAFFFFQVMEQFLLPLFLAVVLVVIFRPFHLWVTKETGNRPRVAAGITTAAILLIVLVPVLTFLWLAAVDGVALVSNLNQEKLATRIHSLRERFHLQMPGKPIMDRLDDLLIKGEQPNGIPVDCETLQQEVIPLVDQLGAAVQDVDFGPQDGTQSFRDLLAARQAQDGDFLNVSVQLTAASLDDPIAVAALPVGEPQTVMLHLTDGPLGQRYVDLRKAIEAATEHCGTDQEYLEKTAGRRVVANIITQLNLLRSEMYGDPLLYRVKTLANPGPGDFQQLRADLQEWFGPLALSTTQFVGKFAGGFVLGLCIMVVALYFFLADGPAMINTIMRLSPLADRYEQAMLEDFDRISRAVVLATLLSAVVQGLLAGIGYYFAGLEAVFLLTVLTALLSMVPFVGAAAVWGGCAAWLFLWEDRMLAASLLAVYGLIVVSLADNIIKPAILHGQSNLHPLLALLSVIGGVKVLGPIGIFVGPMIVAFLQTVLIMLQSELGTLDPEPSAETSPPAARQTGSEGVG